VPAHFDVHRLTERTTLIVVAGEISFGDSLSTVTTTSCELCFVNR